jgi:hypothetical protein
VDLITLTESTLALKVDGVKIGLKLFEASNSSSRLLFTF